MNSLNYFKNPPTWTFFLPRYPFHSKSSQSDLIASFHDPMSVFICLNIYSTSYDTVCLNPGIMKSSQARCMKIGWYLRMAGTSSTTTVTHRGSLATQLSDEPWVWRFIFSAVRLYFTHSSCSLHLNTRLLPHGTRNGLHLGFLNDCQKGIDSENCHFPGSHSIQ